MEIFGVADAMIALLPLLAAVGLFVATAPPPLSTPQELAEWSKCDPAKISYWIGQSVEYTEQTKWDPAEVVMSRKSGDCKGNASVAVAALSRCAGYEPRIIVLHPVDGQGDSHAVALYTDHKGRRGYIDGSRQQSYPPGTPWASVARGVGEKWREAQ